MGTSLVESFWKGLNLAHTVENDKRLADAAKQTALIHQMQMQKMAFDMLISQSKEGREGAKFTQEQSDREAMRNLFNPVAGSVMPGVEPISMQGPLGGLNLPGLPGMAMPDQPSPLSQALGANAPAMQQMLGSGIKIGDAAKVLKEPTIKMTDADLRDRALKGDKHAQAILNSQEASKIKIAKEGRAVFATVPTSTPGVGYDRLNKQWFETDTSGNKRILTSDEVKQRNLAYKEETPTSDIKVMQQSVPSVIQLINQSRASLDKTTTGPLAGRWNQMWSGKVGAANPEFRKLRTDINLLQTRLMKMHVGARGGEYIMKHFEDIINAGKDSPENLKAALDEIETYANEVGSSLKEQRESITIPQATHKYIPGRGIVEIK